MSRKIVIEPTFCEAHFLDAHIQNVCDYLKPDAFILAEGMFPKGPENTTKDIEEFKKKWTLDGARGFDFPLVKAIVEKNREKYPATTFYLLEMYYPSDLQTVDAYHLAYTCFCPLLNPVADDLIFMLESDLFFTEEQATKILEEAHALHPDTGFGSSFRLFFESPFVQIPGAGRGGRRRKVCIRYGEGNLVRDVTQRIFYDDYHLRWLDLKLFHYEWIRPGKYWDLRFDQLARRDITYSALKQAKYFIEKNGPDLKKELEALRGWDGTFSLDISDLKIGDHPPHILDHPNFVKYANVQKNRN